MSEKRDTRQKRIPIDLIGRLTAEPIEGYELYWGKASDYTALCQMGYTPVEDNSEIPILDAEGNHQVKKSRYKTVQSGEGVTLILMKIPKELYDEYQAERKARRQARNAGLYRNMQTHDHEFGYKIKK